jgi:hypothetical protein
MNTISLPEHYKNYSLAFFDYFASGEGRKVQIELLFKDQIPSIGFSLYEPEIIPCTVECECEGQKYLDMNSEFEAKFIQYFGSLVWLSFKYVCLENKNVLDLKLELHYNLS